LASEIGYLEVVKLLLSDKRVDPSANNNLAIQWASRKDHLEVVKLLLSDKRVRDSLDGRDLEKYQRQISTLKEGFSDYLKPKSQEEINKDLSSLLPNKKLRVAIENNLFDFFKEALEEGANPHQNIFSITYSQFYHIVTYITLFCDFKFIKFYLDHVLIDLINSKSYEPLNINIATTLRLKNNIYKTNILSPLSKGNFNKDIYKNYEYLKFFIEKNHIDVRYIK
jgi:ankyrin repeat protein